MKKYNLVFESFKLSNDSTNILQSLIDCGKLSDAEMAELIKMTKIEKVKSVHHYKIRTKYNKDGSIERFITEVPSSKKRSEKSAKTLNALYDKLYEYYFNSFTLEKLFEEWQIYSKTNTARKDKTIKEDLYVYNRFFKGNSITKQDVRKLTKGDFMKFIDSIFMNVPTQKSVGAVRSLINRLYEQAAREGIYLAPPIDGIDFRHRKYKVVENYDEVYTEEERIKLINFLLSKKSLTNYDKAILFMFCFTIRIGELKGLQWEDIDMENNEIFFHRQLDSSQILANIKGNRKTGNRWLPIPDIAYNILSSVEPQNRVGYVFMNHGKPLTTDSFNDTLKRRCKQAGIRYLSSHKIRFANCVLMLEKNVPLYEVQKSMGHSNQAMTEHYNRARQRKTNQSIKNIYNNVINEVRDVSTS